MANKKQAENTVAHVSAHVDVPEVYFGSMVIF